MFFELQIDSDFFGRIVRNRMKLSTPPKLLGTTVSDPDDSSVLMVFNQIKVGEPATIQREKTITIDGDHTITTETASQVVQILSSVGYIFNFKAPYLQVKVPVTIEFVKLSDLETNGLLPSAVYKSLTISPVFNISLTAANQTQGGGPQTLSYSFHQIDYGLVGAAISAEQRKTFDAMAAATVLPPTIVSLAPLSSLLKRPVAAVNAGIACDSLGDVVALRVDFDLDPARPASVDREFFEVGPTNLLTDKDWAMLIDANLLTTDANAKAKAALAASDQLRLESGPDTKWDAGGPAIQISAGVELLDACPFFVKNIDMDADVAINVGISLPAANTLRTHFHIRGTPSDVGEEIACALNGALLWPFIGPLFLKEEPAGKGIGAYLGGAIGGAALTFVGLLSAIQSATMKDDLSQKLGSTCTKQDDENYECNDPMDLVMQLSPPLNSRLELESVSGSPDGLLIGGTISNLGDVYLGELQELIVNPFKWQIVGRCRGFGQNNFQTKNQAKIIVPVIPPAALVSAEVIDDPLGEYLLVVGDNEVTIIPQFKSGDAPPYACKVLLITNRGVRIITLQPPAAQTEQEKVDLEAARLRAIASCYYWDRLITVIEKLGWLIDPVLLQNPVIRYWQVVVRGLQARDSLRVGGRDGLTVLTANPSNEGVAHMTMLFPGDAAPDELTLELIGRQEENDSQREISVQQVLFELRATLPMQGLPRLMRFEGSPLQPRLLINDGEQEMFWDVNEPSLPSLLRSTDAKADGQPSIVVQTGKQVGVEPSPEFLRRLNQLQDQFGKAEIVGSPRVGGFDETLYLRTSHGSVLYDVSNGQAPREIQRFDGLPWFIGVALGGKLMARYEAEQRRIAIYQVVATHLQ